MSRRRVWWVLCIGVATAIPLVIDAQAPSQQRRPSPAASSARRAPDRVARMSDGKPNLNGVWQVLATANWDLEDHPAQAGPFWQLGAIGAQPPGEGVVEGGTIPYNAAGLERKKQNFATRVTKSIGAGGIAQAHSTGDPELKCYMPGVPRATYLPYPFQIVQNPRSVVFVYEFATANRMINMGPPKPAPVDTWMGWSNGRWEGETLVIDVTGLNGLTWLDRAGNFVTENAHIVERYTPIDDDHIDYEATIEDSTIFTRSWRIRMLLYRRIEPNVRLLEFKCQEFAEEFLYGDLYKR